MNKRLFFTVIFTALFAVVNAQSNFGIDYFNLGEYQTAKSYFEKQTTQSSAEINYYLGEIAFAEGKVDDAKAFYEKGIAADPLYMLNYIGKGKLLLKTDQKEAEAIFATATKKDKKNVEVNVAIARAYFQCGLKDVASIKIELTKKMNKKSALVYLFEGDLLTADKKFGEAAGKYEQALYFEPNNIVASIKSAQIYESINPTLAIEILKKVLVAHPDYLIAYRGLGRTFTTNGQYLSAIEAYKKYSEECKLGVDDLVKFATCYYFTDQYALSAEQINLGLKIEPANFVLNRFRMYNAAKLEDVANGLSYAEYFFTLVSEKGFITSDYTSYATILSLNGKFDKALDIYSTLMLTESDKPEIYKELYTVYSKMKNYVKAAETSQKYISLMGAQYVSASDYQSLGRSYYFAANAALKADTTQFGKDTAKGYLIKADSAFSNVCRLAPESYTGYLWRGHTNATLESSAAEGLAKPYYEGALNLILKKDGGAVTNKRDLISCYSYLAFHYFNLNDKENTTKYCTLIVELDPSNETAKQLLTEINKVKK